MAATAEKRRSFLLDEAPQIIQNLTADTKARFGIMTAQHMIEHLLWVTKSTMRGIGEPTDDLTDGQRGFMKFINKGAKLKHRGNTKLTVKNLPDLKLGSFDEALSKYPEGAQRLYAVKDKNPNTHFVNSFMGSLTMDQMELFHYEHHKWHFWQFGLIRAYYTEA